MEQKQVDQIMMMNHTKLAPEYIETIRQRLSEVEYNQGLMAFSDLRDPTIMLVLSILVGELGIDRFLIGDVGIGVGKLVLFVAGWFLCFIPWIVGIPWWIVDIFLIQNATRKYNAEKVMQALSFIS